MLCWESVQEKTSSRRAWTPDWWQASSKVKTENCPLDFIVWRFSCTSSKCSLHKQGLRNEEGVRKRRENVEGTLSRSLVVKGSRGVGSKQEAMTGSREGSVKSSAMFMCLRAKAERQRPRQETNSGKQY